MSITLKGQNPGTSMGIKGYPPLYAARVVACWGPAGKGGSANC